MTRAAVAALSALALLGAGCQSPQRRARRPRAPEAPLEDVPAVDAVSAGRCVRRSSAPELIAAGAGIESLDVAWNGSSFGVAWSEVIDGEEAVMFAQASPDRPSGRAPLRVSERRFVARTPTVAWNGAGWSVLYSGGVREAGDIYQARVDARGTAVGRPWRMTRGARFDGDPRFVANGRGFGLAWTARELDRRWSLYAQPLDRWDAPLSPPTRLLNTSVSLAATNLLWTGSAWAVTCVAWGREVYAIDVARMEANGQARGSITRANSTPLGGAEPSHRYDVAWNGREFIVAWSELRDGVWRIFLRRLSARGNPLEPERALDDGDARAESPSLTSVGEGYSALAYELVGEGRSRVMLRVIDPEGRTAGEPVALPGYEGASIPAAEWSGEVLGVAVRAPTGVAFHRVRLGPCGAG